MRTLNMLAIRSGKRINILLGAILFLGGITILNSCNYLNVVPDDVATLKNAFANRNEAQKYLFTLYSYVPRDGSELFNPGFLGGDELWIPYKKAITSYAFRMARGDQRVVHTYMDAWTGHYQGAGPGDHYALFDGIRHCNVFLKNIKNTNEVPNLGFQSRRRWIGEADFLKAFFLFRLFRMYGPIPLMKKNIPVYASPSQVQVKRQPVDKVINYITTLLDSAVVRLPGTITDIQRKGRVTKPAVLALKARVLLTAASPLFNGNPDYVDFKNKDGEHLFPTSFKKSKWEKAAAAALKAIKVAKATGHKLYSYHGAFNLNDTLKTEVSIEQAVTKPWNSGVIWANTNSLTQDLQKRAMPPISKKNPDPTQANMILSAPIKIANEFYTKHGVPINQDKTLNFSNIAAIRTANHAERYRIKEGFKTARLNFDRGPRFYADLGFDGGMWYKYDSSVKGSFVIRGKRGQYAGQHQAFFFNVTGYYIKKLVNWHETANSTGTIYKSYAWPEIQLDDLYLMYAEAENEVSGPSPEVFKYLNLIRARAGLPGVKKSWNKYSTNPDEYKTQKGLRKIIHHERLIEMAFEGSRFWDLRRWKESDKMLNQPITGWNFRGKTTKTYYQVETLFQQHFIAPRDYLWPITQIALLKNKNLVQNPGW
jgi:hypothetical protein